VINISTALIAAAAVSPTLTIHGVHDGGSGWPNRIARSTRLPWNCRRQELDHRDAGPSNATAGGGPGPLPPQGGGGGGGESTVRIPARNVRSLARENR
jgi:hypothetical protein